MRVAIFFPVAILSLGWISSCGGVGPGNLGFGVDPNVGVKITNNPGGIPQGTSVVFQDNSNTPEARLGIVRPGDRGASRLRLQHS